MIPSCLTQAARDPAVRGVTLALYVVLFERLDFFEFRPAKLSALSRVTGVKKSNLSRSLSALVSRGYLVRGPDDSARRTYRLAVSPAPEVITSATNQVA